MIQVSNPHAQYEAHKREINEAVEAVLDSGNYILGPYVTRFEETFARFCGLHYGVTVNSGTDAITICLRALGIGAGDTVVTVSHTALATVAGVMASGATPRLIDIDPVTYTLDPNKLTDIVDDQVKAIVPVHLYGQPAAMEAICGVADKRGIPVIEDCAQAAGARLEGQRVGAYGRAGIFSFYPTKNLGAIGDGGIIVTDDQELAERIRNIRQYGWADNRVAVEPGLNSRLDELQAAILLSKLPFLDGDNATRAHIADRYSSAFSELPIKTPPPRPVGAHVYHLFVIECDSRTEVATRLSDVGVQTAVHYPIPAHRQPGYESHVQVPQDLTVTERVANRVLSLPLYPELSHAEVDSVIEAVMDVFDSGRVDD